MVVSQLAGQLCHPFAEERGQRSESVEELVKVDRVLEYYPASTPSHVTDVDLRSGLQ